MLGTTSRDIFPQDKAGVLEALERQCHYDSLTHGTPLPAAIGRKKAQDSELSRMQGAKNTQSLAKRRPTAEDKAAEGGKRLPKRPPGQRGPAEQADS